MLTIEKTVLPSPEQWEIIIEGMRNPKNSWGKMDSYEYDGHFFLGDNDRVLMWNLANGGAVHAKYRRMIPVFLTINAPLYWWKEFDTYKVGTVANSCSTMHKIHAKEFTLDDFSLEHVKLCEAGKQYFEELEKLRVRYNETKDKKYWYALIQLLPTSYNQKRTVFLNYEVLAKMYRERKNHKLDEWHTLCDWIKTLPYSELITGGAEDG